MTPPSPPLPPPPGPVVPGDEASAYDEVHLSGPRIGFTILSPAVVNKARESTYLEDLKPFLTQFGWQFETRIFRMPNGTAGLLELVPLIGGLEQGKFIPSLNALVGIVAGLVVVAVVKLVQRLRGKDTSHPSH